MRTGFIRSGALACAVVVVAFGACRDLSLKDPPGPPMPGSISGRVVTALPGRPGVVAITGARVELLGTGLVGVSDESGAFRVEGITTDVGQVLFRADLDGNGVPDRQKLVSLQTLKAGPNKQVALGDVVLSENAVVRGKVLRGDVADPGGHAGTLVFVPVGPYTTTTSNDGSFILDQLPEGTLSIAFFRAGYSPRGFDDVTLNSGQDLVLRTIALVPETTMPPPASISGRVLAADFSVATDATLSLDSDVDHFTATAGADGRFTFDPVPIGVYSITASRPGSSNARLVNILAAGGPTQLPDLVLGLGATTGTGGGGGTTQQGHLVQGRVVLADGTAADGADITLDGFTRNTATSNANGGFAFSGVAPGSYTLTATRSDVLPGRLTNIVVGGADVTLPDLVLFAPNTGGGTGGGGGTTGGGGGTTGGGGGTTGGGGGTTGGGGATGGGGGTTGGGGGTTGGGGGATGGGGGTTGGGGGTTGGGGGVTIPPAPTNVVASSRDTALLVSWNAAAGATSYRVYWSTTPGVSKSNGTRVDTAGSPLLLQGLTNGTPVYCVVTALNAGGESADSAQATGTPRVASSNDPPVLLSTRPEPDARGVFPTSTIMARFDKDLDGLTVIAANITVANGATTVPFTVSAAGPSLTITPLSPLTPERRYDVTLGTGIKDTGGHALPAPVSFGFTTSSAAPVNVRIVNGASAFTVLWDAVPGATGYRVDRQPLPTGTPTSYPATSTTYTFNPAANGAQVGIRVVALTPFGVTPPSNEVQVIPTASLPAAPSGLRVLAAGATSALLTWSNISTNDGWSIYRALQPGGPWTLLRQGWPRTTYADTTIPAGNSAAFYVVQSEALGQVGAYSDELGVRLDPAVAPAPANFVATPGIAWVKLTWNAVPQATGYVVWMHTGNVSPPSQLAWVTNGTRFDHVNLGNGVDYRYFVQAVVDGVGGDLASATATPIVAPSYQWRPVPLTASSTRLGNVTLTYSNPGSATMAVLRSTTHGGPYTLVGSTSFDNSVAPLTTYYYVVRADNGTVQGDLSNEVSVTTPGPTPTTPTGLTVTPSDSAVNVTWTPVSDASTYQVGTSSSSSGPFTASATTLDSHAVQTATNATLTWFAVRSGNGVDWSAWSSPVSATATSNGLATPSVYATPGNGVVTVSWSAVTGATSYRVYRRSPLLTDWVEVLPPTLTLGFNDTGVTNETSYVYQVQALNAGNGTSSPFGTLGAPTRPSTTHAARATGFTVTPSSSGFVVSWNPVAGATSYTVRSASRMGGSFSAAGNVCSAAEAFETRCNLAGLIGTNYYVSLAVLTPDGETASTDEIGPVTPGPTTPATAAISQYAGNGMFVVSSNAVSGVQYRFARRFRGRDWQVLSPVTEPFFFEPQTNGIEVKYALQALAGGNVSDWSVSGFLAPSSQTPPVPSSVTVTPVNAGAIIEWSPVLSGTSTIVLGTTNLSGAGGITKANVNDTLDTIRSVPFTAGQTSFVRISPSGWNLTSMPQPVTPTTAVPPAPTLNGTGGLQAADLDWSAVSGATAYRVYRRIDPGAWRLLVTVPPTVTSLRDQAVENGETIDWAVLAVTSAGITGWSTVRTLTANPSLPAVPNNLVVTPGDAAVTATWDVTPGATGYLVSGSTNGGSSWFTACNFSNAPFENHCRVGATNGTTPLVRVQATNATGSSLPTLAVTGATPASTYPDTISFANVVTNGTGALRVTWSASPDSTSYRVYRRPSNGVATAVMDVTSTTFDDSGLTSGTAYVYYVHGLNAAGSGAWSSASSAVIAP